MCWISIMRYRFIRDSNDLPIIQSNYIFRPHRLRSCHFFRLSVWVHVFSKCRESVLELWQVPYVLSWQFNVSYHSIFGCQGLCFCIRYLSRRSKLLNCGVECVEVYTKCMYTCTYTWRRIYVSDVHTQKYTHTFLWCSWSILFPMRTIWMFSSPPQYCLTSPIHVSTLWKLSYLVIS